MDSRELRDLLGHFATGVTVITTNAGGLLHGMTANAVCSLSLQPPLLLVCVDKRAHCHQQLRDARAFGVNILAADQRALSHLFARTLEPERGSLRGAPHRLLGDREIPILDGVLAHAECRLVEIHPGGDHDIFLGEVVAGAASRDAAPLLFYRGRYRELG